MIAAAFVAICAFGAVLSIAMVIASRGNLGDEEVAKRLNRYGGLDEDVDVVRPSTGNPLRDAFSQFSDNLNPVLARSSYSGQLADDLQKADLKLKASEWILGVGLLSALVGLVCLIRFGNVILLAVGFILTEFLAGMYLRFRQARRRRAFERQLGDVITLLSNALKAGYSFAQAMATVSRSAGAPIGDEFSRATREIGLGISVDEALNHMVQRNKSEDFDLLVTAVQIQRVVGGNLAEILDNIAYTIRERVRIQGEIRTLTAQARMSGIIIFILPIVLATILAFISPDYFGPMLHKPGGLIMLGIGVVMMCFGYGLIQKIVKIEV